jgi:hypothetical protein
MKLLGLSFVFVVFVATVATVAFVVFVATVLLSYDSLLVS